MVAKTYQTYPLLGEPFAANGRMYVNVQTPKGQSKTVRWYTDAEYAKLYGGPTGSSHTDYNAKRALGFEHGPITIFKGDTEAYQEWFELSEARYNTHWGWYYPNHITAQCPTGLEKVSLPWSAVGNSDNTLRSSTEVRKAVDSLLYTSSSSAYQGKLGERIERELTVTKAKKVNNPFGGTTTYHTFEDAAGNLYSWTTSAKSWEVGDKKLIRGTVKEYDTERNAQITVLTRCMERN